MILANRMRNCRYSLVPPDYVGRRGDNRLLVWGDVPCWTVVDREFHELLQALDGGLSVDDILATRPGWASSRREAVKGLEKLAAQGVLREAGGSHGASRRRESPEAKIENVALNLTRRCNLRCRFCYNLHSLTSTGRDDLSAGEVAAFLRSTRPFLAKKPSLTILGGEPLLYPDRLLEVSKAAARMGFTRVVSTNGTVVTPEFAAAARKLGLQVQVSLDGHDAETNDPARGKGSFDRIMRGVRTLVDHRVYTILSLVCHAGNIDHLEDYYRLASSLGVDEARFIPLKRMGGALEGAFEAAPTTQMVLRACSLFRKRPEYARLAGRDCLSILANTCRHSAHRTSCGTGLQTVMLDSDGSVYPCLNTNLPGLRVGNVRNPGFDFARAWSESPVLDRVRRASRVDTPGRKCSGCPVRHWCLGGCRGECAANGGALDGPAPNCDDLKSSIIETMWILAESPDLIRPAARVC